MHLYGHEIKRGERKTVILPVSNDISLEVICCCGERPGKTLVLTSGVHGCEYVGVETLKRLSNTLEPKKLTGNVVLLPIANPSGFFEAAKRVVPEDKINLNRAFPGKKKGSLSSRIAWVIEHALYPAADFLADLHSGDGDEALRPLVFFPVAGEEKVNQQSLSAAKVLTVPYRVRSSAKNGLYSWAVQQGIPAVLIERGGMGLWSEAEVRDCEADVYALMRFLNILEDRNDIPQENEKQQEVTAVVYQEAQHTGFWYPEIHPDDRIAKGQLLGRMENSSGKILQEVRTEFDGIVLYHSIALGIQRGEFLVAYGQI